MENYVVTTPDKLRQICIDEHLFTCGDNEAYNALFFMNEHPLRFHFDDVVSWIYLHSDGIAYLTVYVVFLAAHADYVSASLSGVVPNA